MLDKKKLSSLRIRILKANKSLSACGDLILCLEYDNMSIEELYQLETFIQTHKNPTTHKELARAIQSRNIHNAYAP